MSRRSPLSTNQLQLVIRLTPLHPYVIVGVYAEIKLMCNPAIKIILASSSRSAFGAGLPIEKGCFCRPEYFSRYVWRSNFRMPRRRRARREGEATSPKRSHVAVLMEDRGPVRASQ